MDRLRESASGGPAEAVRKAIAFGYVVPQQRFQEMVSRANISDAGKLSKRGSGTLRLGGDNSYSGGTQLVAGTLQADSAVAFGLGNVYASGGTLVCNAPSPLTMKGAYTQVTDATLQLNIGGDGAGRLSVAGVAALAGTLNVSFKPGAGPKVGDTLTLISSRVLTGRFSTITVQGFKVTPTYTATELFLHIDS